MADTPLISGRTSAFGYAKQTAQGTYAAPTDTLQNLSFDVEYNPQVEVFETLNSLLDSESQTRSGVAKITGKMSAPLYSTQGASLVKGCIGNDTTVATTSFGTVAVAISAGKTANPTDTGVCQVLSISANLPAVPGGVGQWTSLWIQVGTGATVDYSPIVSSGNSQANPTTGEVVAVVGTAGAVTYTYTFTWVTPAGETLASTAVSTATGNATLSGTNYNNITVPAFPTATGVYAANVYRTVGGATQGKIGQITVSAGTLADTGLVASGASPGTNTAVSYIVVWPLSNAHIVGEVVQTPAVGTQHVLNINTGASRATLDFLSFCAQFGTVFERQVQDAQISALNIKADQNRFSVDYDWVASADFPYEGTVVTTIPTAAGEGNDSPLVARDGGLITPSATTDVVPTLHIATISLDYKLQFAVQAEHVGGGVQSVELNVLSSRKQTLSWTEYARQAKFNTFRANYAKTNNEFASMIALLNRKTLTSALSVWMPRCVCMKYDGVGPTDKPVGYTGEIKPLIDQAGSGVPVKLVLWNLSSSAL